jgi:hypothetical protein
LIACIFAPISIFKELYSQDQDLECWEEMLVYPLLLIGGILALPFLFFIGIWIMIKRFKNDDEIAMFSMFYEEL